MSFARYLSKAKARSETLSTTTLRDFSGMWNTAQNEFNLNPRYLTEATNVTYDYDGTVGPRYGYDEVFRVTDTARQVAETVTITVTGNQVFVNHVNHGLVSGSNITIRGVPDESTNLGGFDLTRCLDQTFRVIVDADDRDRFRFFDDDWGNGTVTGTLDFDVADFFNADDTANIVGIKEFQDRLVFVTNAGTIGYYDLETEEQRVLFNDNIANTSAPRIVTETTLTFTSGSRIIRVNIPSENILEGDLIFIQDFATAGGISGNRVNSWHEVREIEETDSVNIATDTAATATGDHFANVSFTQARGWSSTDECSFSGANDEMFITNGVDKPVRLSFSRQVNASVSDPVNRSNYCRYLADPVTDSNAFVPIAKFVTFGDNYLIFAGIPGHPNRVRISMQGGYGTYFRDADDPDEENDAIDVDLDTIGNVENDEITGIYFYKKRLVVTFSQAMMLASLGGYVEGVHVPVWSEDTVKNYGAIRHHTIVQVGSNLLAADAFGVVALNEGFLEQTLKPERPSAIVDRDAQELINHYPLPFALYDIRNSQYLLFSAYGNLRETDGEVLVYKNVPSMKVSAWSKWQGLDASCGDVFDNGDVYFAKNSVVYKMGSPSAPVYEDVDQPIVWSMTTPWIDFGDRFRTKTIKYIKFDTLGYGDFTVDIYVDNLNDEVAYSMDFVGKDYGAFGTPVDGERPINRNTRDAFLWAINVKCCMLKIKISGSSSQRLRIAGISMSKALGSIRR